MFNIIGLLIGVIIRIGFGILGLFLLYLVYDFLDVYYIEDKLKGLVFLIGIIAIGDAIFNKINELLEKK